MSNTQTLSFIETINLEIKYIYINNMYCIGPMQHTDT
jgi:hypothetical protein